MHKLIYDKKRWHETDIKPINTLQVFITNRCNLRCRECFYRHKLGNDEMSFEKYKEHISVYKNEVQKITLLGGEPTMHKDIVKMLKFNNKLGLKSTIYTNGYNLEQFEKHNLPNFSIRLGAYGSTKTERPLSKVKRTPLEIIMVYMLRKDNVTDLMEIAKIAEKEFNCKGLYIASMREILITKNYWTDTKDTLSMEEYYQVVQDFVSKYKGNIPKLHIATRGVITTDKKYKPIYKHRFGNIFPDGKKIICPFDISLYKTTKKLMFNKARCNKNCQCLLQKIVLEKK